MKDADSDATAMPLSELLRSTAAELKHLQPPPSLSDRVLASQRALSVHSPLSRPDRRRWRLSVAWSGAALGTAALCGSLLLLFTAPRQPLDAVPAAAGFVPVVGPERWRQLVRDSATPAWLVIADLPREKLAALGLPFDPARAAEPVRAELLMHASGDVLALRVIGE
jgi:hypothetical protein